MRGGWFWEGDRLKDVCFSAAVDNVRAIGNELLYTGRRRDPETGLQLNRNRFYHQQLGRWVNRDPIGYDGGVSVYEYVNGMPVGFVDPSGQIVGGGIIVGGAAAIAGFIYCELRVSRIASRCADATAAASKKCKKCEKFVPSRVSYSCLSSSFSGECGGRCVQK